MGMLSAPCVHNLDVKTVELSAKKDHARQMRFIQVNTDTF